MDEEKTTLEGPNGASFQTCAYGNAVFRQLSIFAAQLGASFQTCAYDNAVFRLACR
ncbi:MAG: hypothetical protein Q8M62_21290 [Algoriphagus sp.]|nr:hypothetical protein [Algoriphagus sp.]MDO8968974.1 hypothetical protein [Algoriphagus sp.]MDP3202381.1 hypothetical protein [Algoriphagus sp.]